MKAVIMAGGEGTRLRPLTVHTPKPLLPLANKPMMEHVIALLRNHGIDEVVVTVAFMANSIRDWFGDGSDHGVRISYSVEDFPLGTAGSVGNARALLDESFMVISGDVLTDIDLGAIAAFHQRSGAVATVGLVRVDDPIEFGIVITKEDGSIERFLEKPSWGQVFSDTVNSGIFVLEPEIFDFIEPGTPVDFSSDVFPKVLETGAGLFGAVVDGYWEDVGTLDAYLRSHFDILDSKVSVDIAGFEMAPGVWVGEGSEVHPTATLHGPVILGDNCTIESGATLGPYAVLGDNGRVRRDVVIERSVVLEHSYIGEGVRLQGTVIGRSCDLRRGARSEEGVVLGDQTFVGEEAVIGPGVKVFPRKTIEARSFVNSSIVWESRGARTLFREGGLRGLSNVDVSPELATRVAMAFGSALPKGATVMTSRDSSRSGRMLKRSMMAGFNAVGVNVLDLEVASVPLTRFGTRQPAISAGVSIRLDEQDPQQVLLNFFDTDGLDIAEDSRRRLERLFHREDFRRVIPQEIGDIGFPPRLIEHYATAICETVDLSVLRERKLKAVLDYSFGSTSFLMPDVLAKLGTDVLAVNPYASTAGFIRLDRETQLADVAALVRSSGADLGGVLTGDGTRLTIVDDEGRVLDGNLGLMLVTELIAPTLTGRRIALPVNVTSHGGSIARKAGLEVIDTPIAPNELLAAAVGRAVGFAATDDGGFILPDFLPALDGAAMFVKLLEMTARSPRPLGELVGALPGVHMATGEAHTPWDKKGQVMRSLVERSPFETVLVDGVKILNPDGWILASPDPVEPTTNLWAEAADSATAEQIVEEYKRRIAELVVGSD